MCLKESPQKRKAQTQPDSEESGGHMSWNVCPHAVKLEAQPATPMLKSARLNIVS